MCVDKSLKSVVITIRGTLSIQVSKSSMINIGVTLFPVFVVVDVVVVIV